MKGSRGGTQRTRERNMGQEERVSVGRGFRRGVLM